MDDAEVRPDAQPGESGPAAWGRMEHVREQSAASLRAAGQMRAEAAEMRRASKEQFADTVAQRKRIRRMRAETAANREARPTGVFSVAQPREER
jgi:hypothetical protein